MRQAYTPACLSFFVRQIFMLGLICKSAILFFGCAAMVVSASAQSNAKAVPDSTASAQKGLSLAGQGRCREALPLLKKSAPQTSDKDLKLKAGLAAVRCALALNQFDSTVSTLSWLNRDFPSDPQVLYVTTHALSDLSTRAAVQLANGASGSVQAHELNAEALESQGKWDEAVTEYNEILNQQPDIPGIHYRIGRIILSKPPTATTGGDARKEFEAELQIDPKNAGAEYILGEISREAQQWDEAIEHFSKATKLDAGFADAFLALGFSLSSAGRYAEAIPPLETGVKLQPANPAAHYQLAIAYGRVGREQDAQREAMLQKETADQIEQAKKKAAGIPQ